jgi:hypothetical protein
MAKQIIDLYKTSKIKEKNASSQKVDFIKSKVNGQIAVDGFTPKATLGISGYNTDEKVLEGARKGKVNLNKYSSSTRR